MEPEDVEFSEALEKLSQYLNESGDAPDAELQRLMTQSE